MSTSTVPDSRESRKLQEAIDEVRESASDPLHLAFLTRAMKAVTRLSRTLSEDLLGEATSSSSDYEVLAAALGAAPELPMDETDAAWLRAKLRGVEAKRQLLEDEGGTASSSELAQLLGISRQAVDKRRRNNTLLAVQAGGRGYRYPVWQVVDGRALAGLEDVLEALADHDPWMTLQFFLRENLRLDNQRPLDVLREGSDESLEDVLAAARTYGEQGAD